MWYKYIGVTGSLLMAGYYVLVGDYTLAGSSFIFAIGLLGIKIK